MKNKKKINEMTAGSVLMGPNTDCTGHGGDVPGGSDFYAKGDARIPKVLGKGNVITRIGNAKKRKRKNTLFDSYFNKALYPRRIIKELNTSFVLTITQKNLERIVEHMVQEHTEVYDTVRNDYGHLKIKFNTDDNNFEQLSTKLVGMFEDRLNKSIFLNIEKTVQPILTEKEYLKGGLADGLSDNDLAKKHNEPLKKVKKSLKRGAQVEKEHTSNPNIAREIAKDHVAELGSRYYPELDKMEKKIKRNK
jgi:hypothetical protein